MKFNFQCKGEETLKFLNLYENVFNETGIIGLVVTITRAIIKHIIQDSLKVSLIENFFLDFLENLFGKYETSS